MNNAARNSAGGVAFVEENIASSVAFEDPDFCLQYL
jgi:hypothetical protein